MGAEAGDALITVKIAPHPRFRVEGRDLRLDLPVTLYEAALGAKVSAPTLSGTVELAVPPGSNGGRVLRLRGKGLPASRRQARGRSLRRAQSDAAGNSGCGIRGAHEEMARRKAL